MRLGFLLAVHGDTSFPTAFRRFSTFPSIVAQYDTFAAKSLVPQQKHECVSTLAFALLLPLLWPVPEWLRWGFGSAARAHECLEILGSTDFCTGVIAAWVSCRSSSSSSSAARRLHAGHQATHFAIHAPRRRIPSRLQPLDFQHPFVCPPPSPMLDDKLTCVGACHLHSVSVDGLRFRGTLNCIKARTHGLEMHTGHPPWPGGGSCRTESPG